MKKTIKSLEDWEIQHKILFFIIVFCLTIIFLRVGVQIYNPNPFIGGFELHHFDYGLILLSITAILLLFGKRREFLYMMLTAMSFGMIFDDIIFVRVGDVMNLKNETLVYNSTLPGTIIIAVIITFTILIINYFIKKNKKD
jgi:hypothetical protein